MRWCYLVHNAGSKQTERPKDGGCFFLFLPHLAFTDRALRGRSRAPPHNGARKLRFITVFHFQHAITSTYETLWSKVAIYHVRRMVYSIGVLFKSERAQQQPPC
jgi:hypothetical protein